MALSVAMLATALGLWGALVLLFAAPLALTGRASWPEAVSFGGSFWALWLLFLPAVAWLSFRFPIERSRLLRNTGIHLLACLLVVGTTRATFRAVARIFPFPQRSEAPGRPSDSTTDTPQLQHQPRRFPPLPPRRPLDLVGPPNALGVFLALRAALDVLVYWSLVGVCQGIRNFRISQERERRAIELEARLTSAKLQALRMQINPHFLFNTLNSIATLVYVNPRAADEMLGDLSELLRRSLDSMEEQEIPLAQELEFIGGYISIEQKRFGERLRVEQSVPDELMKALVPALVLQPLVENAIRHGIEPRRGPGLISIEAKQEGKHLHLIIRDNGRGLPGADLNSSVGRGIGLANTKARLQGLYGQDQSFSFGRAAPQGCRVDIHLPFHFEPVHVPTVSNEPAA
jgi:histidine kinase/histidine kinase/DNA gyrase B/HSP90-like ATPase